MSGQVAAGELTVDEAADMSVLMLIAGHETTVRLAIPIEDVQFKHEMVVYGVHSLPVAW